MRSLFLLLCMLPSVALATIMPENDLDKEDCLRCENASIDETLFNKISDNVIDAYKEFAAANGGELIVHKLWDDPTVNAVAYQEGSEWHVEMYGGLARRKEITPDGFALVACHEVGHHLGGFPKYGRNSDWGATEGQADTFATKECAKRLWGTQTELNAKLAKEQPPEERARKLCDYVYAKNGHNRNLCYRSANAGKSLALLLAAGGKAPSLNTQDSTKVTKTKESHPEAQCRLDTYLSGALCWMKLAEGVIVRDENQDVQYSCTEKKGFPAGTQARPRCWFRPGL